MTLPPGHHADYTPLFITQILETIGGHFDRHQATHQDLMQTIARIDHKLEALVADLATALADLDTFVTEAKSHFATLQAAVADLTAKLDAAGSAVPPDVQAAADHIEQVITDAKAAIDAAPAVPTSPSPPQG